MHQKWAFRDWLAATIVLIAAILDGWVLVYGLPDRGQVDAAFYGGLLTAWNTAAAGVLAFYYGRSQDSDRKTELLANATPAITPSVAQQVSDQQTANQQETKS